MERPGFEPWPGTLCYFFFVICLFLLVHRRYNIKEVNLLITVYSIYTAYNLTKSRKKREVTIDKTLLGISYIKQGNSTYIKDYIVLCSWVRHFTLTVLLSTQLYTWVPVNSMLRLTLRWLVALCYRKRDKRGPSELLGSAAGLNCFSTQTHPSNGFLSSAELVSTRHFTHLFQITAFIIHQIFSLGRDWSKHVT